MKWLSPERDKYQWISVSGDDALVDFRHGRGWSVTTEATGSAQGSVCYTKSILCPLSGLGFWTEGSVAEFGDSFKRHFAIGNASWECFLEGGGGWGVSSGTIPAVVLTLLHTCWLHCRDKYWQIAFPLLYRGSLPSSLGCYGFCILEPRYRFLISILAVLSRLGTK